MIKKVYRLQVTGYRLVIALFLFFLLLVPVTYNLAPIYAEEPSKSTEKEFATSYDVTYDVGADGITTVTEKVTLKNLTSQYYATSFSLTIGSTQITDVSASDSSGPMEVATKQEGTSTTLSVKFNQQVAGEGKTLPWTLKFKSKDFASRQGKIWEVTVPKVLSSTNLESYNLTVSIPQSFGEPTAISPNPKKQTTSFDKRFLSFDKEQLTTSGVSASFGTNQLFDFDLAYHLENPNLVTAITNIALPPDTPYQEVIIQRIDPKPLNVTVDEDGNYLAWYKLSRGQRLDIKVTGSARLYANSRVKHPTLDSNLRKKYTDPAKYWDKDHVAIRTKLSEILGNNPPSTNLEKVRLIHIFVSNYLKYDASRLSGSDTERLGAVAALNNPQAAVCMEFTDLFIALARAAGIPARELDGFAYTANTKLRPLSLDKDILHAWPEFYDEQRGWIMIDPTWQNTTGGVDYFNKLDLNHFVFVTKGISSEQPVPAGSYKYAGQDTRDVRVNFADKDFLGKSQIDVQIDVPSPIIAGLPSKMKIRVLNLGNGLQQSANFAVNAGQITILDNGNKNLGPVPAFGHGEFEYNIRTKSLLDNYKDSVEVMVGGQKFKKEIEVKPFIIFQYFPWVLIGLIGALGLLYFGLLGTLLYRRRFRKSVAKS